MTGSLRAGMCQITSTDDVTENVAMVTAALEHAAEAGAQMALTPEVSNMVSFNRAHQRAALSDEDVRTLSAFNAEIVEGMPTGVTEISNLVQRAVADYMKERRAAETARNTARDTAEAAVKDFLRELLA